MASNENKYYMKRYTSRFNKRIYHSAKYFHKRLRYQVIYKRICSLNENKPL